MSTIEALREQLELARARNTELEGRLALAIATSPRGKFRGSPKGADKTQRAQRRMDVKLERAINSQERELSEARPPPAPRARPFAPFACHLPYPRLAAPEPSQLTRPLGIRPRGILTLRVGRSSSHPAVLSPARPPCGPHRRWSG